MDVVKLHNYLLLLKSYIMIIENNASKIIASKMFLQPPTHEIYNVHI